MILCDSYVSSESGAVSCVSLWTDYEPYNNRMESIVAHTTGCKVQGTVLVRRWARKVGCNKQEHMQGSMLLSMMRDRTWKKTWVLDMIPGRALD